MTAVINIFAQKFGSSKNLPIFVVRTGERLSKSEPNIQAVAFNKATSLRQFYFGSLDLFAKHQGGVASCCVFIIHKICFSMRTGTNLQADARGASASTPNTRKRVTSTCAKSAQTQSSNSQRTALNSQRSALSELNEKIARQTARSIKPYSVQKLTEELQRATQKHTYRVSLSCVYPGRVEGNISKIGIYHTDLYEAVSETEAVGIAVSMVKQRYAFFNIDLENIKSVKLPKHIAL